MREEPLLDGRGFETGESKPIYGDVTELRCNISPATGEEAVEAFGSVQGPGIQPSCRLHLSGIQRHGHH